MVFHLYSLTLWIDPSNNCNSSWHNFFLFYLLLDYSPVVKAVLTVICLLLEEGCKREKWSNQEGLGDTIIMEYLPNHSSPLSLLLPTSLNFNKNSWLFFEILVMLLCWLFTISKERNFPLGSVIYSLNNVWSHSFSEKGNKWYRNHGHPDEVSYNWGIYKLISLQAF